MKITYSSENIASFGGIIFADGILKKSLVYEMFKKYLPKRGASAQYNYVDLIRTMFLSNLCGGECAEDVEENLRKELLHVKGLNLFSADTFLRMQKELATEKEVVKTEKGVIHELNTNPLLNELLVDTALFLNQIKSNVGYTLDFDNVFTPTEKYDAKRSYKQKNGYFPGVASIGNTPVFVENRNGNSGVKFRQSDVLTQIFDLLDSKKIKIDKLRMDCGSYSEDVIEKVEFRCDTFYIRANKSMNFFELMEKNKNWKVVEINNKEYELTSIMHTPFKGGKEYRYVVSREIKKNDQLDVFTGKSYTYRAIITNDKVKSDDEIVNFYNQRGASEKLFDELNNDFNWAKLPFSFLNQNTVFMVLQAICKVLFQYVKQVVSKSVDFVDEKFRLKKFILRFVVLPAKWIRQGRQEILKIFTSKKYTIPI